MRQRPCSAAAVAAWMLVAPFRPGLPPCSCSFRPFSAPGNKYAHSHLFVFVVVVVFFVVFAHCIIALSPYFSSSLLDS
jgi:hypothetical protein